MSQTDSPLKVLVQDFAIDFAAWLLHRPVDEVRHVRPANVELQLENNETQARLFTALINLMRDEEVIEMTEKLLQKIDRGLLTDTPYLRRVRQDAREEALAEASEELLTKQAEWSAKQYELQAAAHKAQDLMRDSVLDVLAEQFNPPATDYRRVAAQLQQVTNLEVLRALLQKALRAADFAAFEQILRNQLENAEAGTTSG